MTFLDLHFFPSLEEGSNSISLPVWWSILRALCVNSRVTHVWHIRGSKLQGLGDATSLFFPDLWRLLLCDGFLLAFWSFIGNTCVCFTQLYVSVEVRQNAWLFLSPYSLLQRLSNIFTTDNKKPITRAKLIHVKHPYRFCLRWKVKVLTLKHPFTFIYLKRKSLRLTNLPHCADSLNVQSKPTAFQEGVNPVPGIDVNEDFTLEWIVHLYHQRWFRPCADCRAWEG